MKKYDVKEGKYGKIFIPKTEWDEGMTEYCLTHDVKEIYMSPALSWKNDKLPPLESLRGILVVRDSEYGKQLIVNDEWNPEMTKYCLSNNIQDIYMNIGWGWRGKDLSFLAELKENIVSVGVLCAFLPDPYPIESLTRLKNLSLSAILKKKINLACFPRLEEIYLNWNNNVKSLFDCKGLKRIGIYRFNTKRGDLSEFSRFVDLESLWLSITNIQRMGNLSVFKRLKTLEIARATKLESLDVIEDFKSLEKLELDTCRKIGNIQTLGSLENLEVLFLNNCGKIDSLKPIENLKKLRQFLFYDDTDIVDGDLTPLQKLPDLQKLAFMNRKHYNLFHHPLWNSHPSELEPSPKK